MSIVAMIEIRYSSPSGVPDWYDPGKVSKKIKNITDAVVRQHKKDISVNYYPSRIASKNKKHAEFPRKRTGNLRSSVGYSPKSIVIKKSPGLREINIAIGYDETICDPAKFNSLRNGARGPGKRYLAPRKMMPHTGRSVIPIELAKSNPDPWIPTAEWKPLTWGVVSS